VNPVLILSYNGLPDLQRCIDSVRMQDIETYIVVLDNGSTDGSREWLATQHENGLFCIQSYHNSGVSAGWNHGLRLTFANHEWDSVLVLNLDTVLPTYFYRELLSYNVPLVTGKPVYDPMEVSTLTGSPMASEARRGVALQPHPCFSAFLLTRACWETVGPFDESMFGWASDCDLHARAHRLGVGFWKAQTPFWHQAGSTTRNAPEKEREWFIQQANRDRAAFKAKWGCEPGTEEYSALFSPDKFGVDR
jgi:GT2 family glycosyltransferase